MMAGELKWAMVFDGRKLPSYADDKEDDALPASGGSCEPKMREISVTGGWGERKRGCRIAEGERGERREEKGFVVDSKEERGGCWIMEEEHIVVGEGGGDWGERRRDGDGFGRRGARCRPVIGEGGGERGEEMGMRMASAEGEQWSTISHSQGWGAVEQCRGTGEGEGWALEAAASELRKG